MRKLFQPLGNFPGFQLGNNTAAAALNSDLPATQFWADQNSLSSSHPFHSKADDAAWESPSDFGIDEHQSSWTVQRTLSRWARGGKLLPKSINLNSNAMLRGAFYM